LPYLSDLEKELDKMIKTAKEYGADFVFVGSLTLFGKGPEDCKMRYYKFLQKHYPALVPKYKKLFRIFFQPPKEYQRDLQERARRICKDYGIKMGLI